MWTMRCDVTDQYVIRLKLCTVPPPHEINLQERRQVRKELDLIEMRCRNFHVAAISTAQINYPTNTSRLVLRRAPACKSCSKELCTCAKALTPPHRHRRPKCTMRGSSPARPNRINALKLAREFCGPPQRTPSCLVPSRK